MTLISGVPAGLLNPRTLQLWATLATVILVVIAASGCVMSSGDGPPPCMPPAYSVDPSSASRGETVRVTASDADCDPRYGENALIWVVVTDAAGVEIIDETADMNDAGGFTYSFEIPPHAAPGEGFVTATPYAVDWCDDTGRNNRAGGTVPTLQLVACATPMKPLTVTP